MSRDDISIQILRKVVIDGLLVVALVLSILAMNIYWLPFQRGFFCGDESLMYPYHDDTVTVLMLRVGGLGLPTLAFFILEWAYLRKEQQDQRCLGVRIPAWVRSFYCALISFGVGMCFIELASNVAKHTIGRPRPHFFDVCRPSVDCSLPEWQGKYVQPKDYECTGLMKHKFGDMRKSFLSGHSAWAAYSMIYLALYLQKRMVWRGTRVPRLVLQFGVVMLSWFTALSRVSDFKHHWSDVLAGYSMGAIFAVLMWVWGTELVRKKKEHSPLPQHDMNLVSYPPVTSQPA